MWIESFDFYLPHVKGDNFTQWLELDHAVCAFWQREMTVELLGANCAEVQWLFKARKKHNSWQTVLPNDMSMPIHPVHCKQKTIWHQTLDTEYTLNTFPYCSGTLIYSWKTVWWCISYILFHRQKEECHHGQFLYITPLANKLIATESAQNHE